MDDDPFLEEAIRATVHEVWGEGGKHAAAIDRLIEQAHRTTAAEHERDAANSQACGLAKLLETQHAENRVPFPT